MSDDFRDFVRAVISADSSEVSRRLAADPQLATVAAATGASRRESKDFFFADIAHYLYQGDTALHLAAAAFKRPVAEMLIASGANVRARNRRGVEPLHYAADAKHWNPDAQADTIAFLISAGGDPNALDKSGVAPLHRAVRTRSLPAVRALLDGGANPTLANGSGSLPLDLAWRSTGRGGASSLHSREQQAGIVKLLTEHLH